MSLRSLPVTTFMVVTGQFSEAVCAEWQERILNKMVEQVGDATFSSLSPIIIVPVARANASADPTWYISLSAVVFEPIEDFVAKQIVSGKQVEQRQSDEPSEFANIRQSGRRIRSRSGGAGRVTGDDTGGGRDEAATEEASNTEQPVGTSLVSRTVSRFAGFEDL